jgi:hypothetical protein
VNNLCYCPKLCVHREAWTSNVHVILRFLKLYFISIQNLLSVSCISQLKSYDIDLSCLILLLFYFLKYVLLVLYFFLEKYAQIIKFDNTI